MSEFTKGPWEWVESDHYGYSALWNPETRHEVIVTGGINDGDDPITWMGEELTDGDKSLIAAAPELLEALEAMLSSEIDYMELNNLGNPALQHNVKLARLAIAKANGESFATNTKEYTMTETTKEIYLLAALKSSNGMVKNLANVMLSEGTAISMDFNDEIHDNIKQSALAIAKGEAS